MEVLAKLGIDWKLLIAQAVNFVILLLILKRYAYKPILAYLDERAAKIESGIKNAEAAEKKLATSLEEEKKILAVAREEARQTIAKAEEHAKKRDELMLSETKEKIEKMIKEADVHLAEKQAKLIREAKGELSQVVMLAVEKILHEKMNESADRALIEKTLGEVK